MQIEEITMLNTYPEQQRALLKTKKCVMGAKTAWESLIYHWYLQERCSLASQMGEDLVTTILTLNYSIP